MFSRKKPLIYIIIPIFNYKKIEDVISKSYLKFELIVINDDFKDAAFKIIHLIKDTQLKVF